MNPEEFENLYKKVAQSELALHNYNSYLRWAKTGADNLIMYISKA